MGTAALGIFLFIAQVPVLVEAFAIPTSFNCQNSLIADEWRRMVLEFHNERRRDVSEGKQRSGDKVMPAAKDMSELVWDCNLEQEAMNSLATCKDYAGTRAANEAEITEKPCNVTSGTKSILREWWNEIVKAGPLKQENNYDEKTIPHFGKMAYYASTIMACAYDRCDSSTKLLCLYNRKPGKNKPLYEKGDMCTGANCKCIDRLCQSDPKYVADPSTCKKALMTDEMEETAVNMHNYYRRLIATGWAEDPKSIYAPRASKMNYVKFDCDNLAAPMKAAINKCQVPADAPGQNVHVVGTWDISRQAALEEAITAWYEGLEKGGGIGADNIYTSEVEANKMLKQYATLAHDEIAAVGCAVKTCRPQGNTIVACKYDVLNAETFRQPFLDNPIYTVGKPCSECSKNTNANKQCEADSLKALCVA
ncbi:hypothetical protein Aduo_000172 [Ancylostoma duodenale]